MFEPTRLLVALSLCITVAALLAAGCGDDDEAGSTTAAVAAALPIEERVVDGGLGGLPSAGPVEVARTPEEFVELVGSEQPGEEAAAYEAAGFVEGAVKPYGNGDRPSGISAAVQLGSPEQALAELDRIADRFATNLPPNATQDPLPGVPDSRAVVASDAGFAFGIVSFADGPFVYAQLAAGPEQTLDPQAVLDAATALYEKVQGSPAP